MQTTGRIIPTELGSPTFSCGDFMEEDGRTMKNLLETAFIKAQVGEAVEKGTKEGESLRTQIDTIQVM